MNAARSRWPRSWSSRSTIPSSATTPAPPSDRAARAIFLPASTSARCSASCSRVRSPRWPHPRTFSQAAPAARRIRSRRSRRGKRTARPPTSCAQRGDAIPTVLRSHPPASRRSQRRRPAPRSVPRSVSVGRPPGVVVGATCPTSLRGRADRQRAARRDAGAPGRHARRRPARGATSTAGRRTAAVDARRSAVDAARSRTYLDATRSRARAGLAGGDQPARGRLDPRRGRGA